MFAQSEIFVENKGQFPSKVKAFAALNIGNVWLCDDGLWFHFCFLLSAIIQEHLFSII